MFNPNAAELESYFFASLLALLLHHRARTGKAAKKQGGIPAYSTNLKDEIKDFFIEKKHDQGPVRIFQSKSTRVFCYAIPLTACLSHLTHFTRELTSNAYVDRVEVVNLTKLI